jgi:CHAD domain-containing protein
VSTVSTETAAQRKVAADALNEALDSERYRKMIALVHAWRSDPPYTAAAQEPASAVSGYIAKAKKKVTKRLTGAVAARKSGEPSDELFHRARKAGKRHRYAVEAAIPLWGSKAQKIVDARKDLQDVLGAHQDRIVQSAFLRELGARLGVRSGQNGFSYGLLYAKVTAGGDSILRDLKPFL